ncbi:MAG: YdcF family protein [Rickettsiaceae bacterium]|jgi:uncharacterized SAM-binding protein YcdF (DUF218 family)|nr:YdcF family protein [Rickettsiaceae bacterium]
MSTKFIRYMFLALLISFCIWLSGLVLFVKTIPNTNNDDTLATDGIVILTGGTNRLDAGIKLLNEKKANKLLISGVGKEANLASLLILSGNLPDNIAQLTDSIQLGYEAKNTKQNAEEAARWVRENNFQSIRLVTSNYHINRSMAEFKKQLPDVKIIPYSVTPNNFELKQWWKSGSMKKLLVLEYNKYLLSHVPFLSY